MKPLNMAIHLIINIIILKKIGKLLQNNHFVCNYNYLNLINKTNLLMNSQNYLIYMVEIKSSLYFKLNLFDFNNIN
jgi:hypothetical protein